MAEIRIGKGSLRASVRPHCGGVVSSLSLAGTDILRPMPAASTVPLDSAMFPLVPYANRIESGRFPWHGTDIQLPRNFPPDPSALHGTGWQSPWQAVEQTSERCVIAYDHAASAWPWDFGAVQTFELRSDEFMVTLEVMNRSSRAMPAGLGLHPYFRRRPETRVFFDARALVLTGEDQIPTGETGPADLFGDFAAGACLPEKLIDHCYTGWAGLVAIEDDIGRIEIRASGASCLHVYAPPGTDILCLEPVTHRPDALNRWPHDLAMLAPGDSTGIAVRIVGSLN